MLVTAVLSSLGGMLGGVAQDIIKYKIDQGNKRNQNELEIKKIKELADHQFELDKKRAEANLDLANIDLQKTQIEADIQQSNVTVAEQATEQSYFNNITQATLDPLNYQVPFLQMQPYTDSTLANTVIGFTNLIYALVNATIGLCGIVKYLRESLTLARPCFTAILLFAFINSIAFLVPEDKKEAVECLACTLEFVLGFWFYGRRSEKMSNIFQKKN